MYRAITVLALEAGIGPEDEEALAALAGKTTFEVNTSVDDRPDWEVRVDGRDLTGAIFEAGITPALTRIIPVAGGRKGLAKQEGGYRRDGVRIVWRDIRHPVCQTTPPKI